MKKHIIHANTANLSDLSEQIAVHAAEIAENLTAEQRYRLAYSFIYSALFGRVFASLPEESVTTTGRVISEVTQKILDASGIRLDFTCIARRVSTEQDHL